MPPKDLIKSMQAYARLLGNALDMAVSSELTDEVETAHTKVYEEAKQRYFETMQTLNAVLDASPVGATPTVTVQAKKPAQIVEEKQKRNSNGRSLPARIDSA